MSPSGQRCDGTSLGAPGLRSHTSTAEAVGSTPCGGTKTPTCQVVRPKKKIDVRGQTEYTSHARSPGGDKGGETRDGGISEEPTKRPMKERGERGLSRMNYIPPSKYVEVLHSRACECDLIWEWACG